MEQSYLEIIDKMIADYELEIENQKGVIVSAYVNLEMARLVGDETGAAIFEQELNTYTQIPKNLRQRQQNMIKAREVLEKDYDKHAKALDELIEEAYADLD